MPHLSRKHYTKSGAFYRVIKDGFRTYPTVDHWIEDSVRRHKWNKRRSKFLEKIWR